MPFVNCPACGELFYLNVRENLEEWNARFPISPENVKYIECFGCSKELKEFDIIEVLAVPESDRDIVSVGDVGTVVFVYSNDAFEVKCVMDDGSTKWLVKFPRNFIKYVQNSQNY